MDLREVKSPAGAGGGMFAIDLPRKRAKLAKNTSKPFSHEGTKLTKQSNTAKR